MPLPAAISTGRRNTLVFSQSWSDENEVSSPRIFHGQAEVGDLGQMATQRVDELDLDQCLTVCSVRQEN
jgi:hypothetical protein